MMALYRYSIFMGLLILLGGCMGYQKSMEALNDFVIQNNFDEASSWVSKKKIMQKSRNEVLLNLELGLIEHMKGNSVGSNSFLQKADFLVEDRSVNAGQRAMSLISNPLSLPYQTEFFENIAIHYYKCLNYIKLNNVEGARVEARRANIALDKLNDKVPDKPLKYHDDVLAHLIMGLTYEMDGDINNAFIAYRNAVDLFIDEDGKLRKYMGRALPNQLKQDLFRTAKVLNFGSDLNYYQKILKTKYKKENAPYGEFVLFWENGRAPTKKQVVLDFGLSSNNGGLNIFNDGNEIYSSLSREDMNNYNFDVTQDRVTIALPIYQNRYYPLVRGKVLINGKTENLEVIEDLNVIAVQSLKDRYLRELGNAILRVLTKRAIQETLSQIDLSGLENKEDKEEEDTPDEKSANNEKTNSSEGKKAPVDSPEKSEKSDDESGSDIDLGQLFNMVSSITEKADIRSWQSLPAEIHYQRVPLKKGQNKVTVALYDKRNKEMVNKTFNLNGNGKIYVKNIVTPYNVIVNEI